MGVVRWVFLFAAAASVAVLVVVLLAQRAWRTTVEALDREVASGAPGAVRIPDASIPEPVARYLEVAVPASAPVIRTARLRQEGTFQMGEGEEGWRPFTADEVFRVHPPAFYWDARIRMAPGTAAFVRDSYLDGSANMVGKVAGLVTVVDEASSPELVAGALARYLAEAVWFPTRMATAPGLTWSAVDAHRASATLTDGEVSVSLTFTFDERGDPVRVEGVRARATDAGFVSTPWVGSFSDHGEMGGFRIPRYGEVGWVIDGVLVPYWRGRILTAEYR